MNLGSPRRLEEAKHCLGQKTIAFLVCAPDKFLHSNGIRVLLDAALVAQSYGLHIVIVPSNCNFLRVQSLPFPYESLQISWEVPDGCSAILCDTVSEERLAEVRARASQVCHYSLAPNGLFGAGWDFANRLRLKDGERQAVYSPHVSTRFPVFYLQTRFPDLEPLIRTVSQASNFYARRDLAVSIYSGKGHLRFVDSSIAARASRSRSRLITRSSPPTKPELYAQLVASDLLISFDPITSLAFEATLLGLPVFIPVSWDEADFISSYPVRLDGIVFGDPDKFSDLLSYGFDHNAVVESYRLALSRNCDVLLDLLLFAFAGDGGSQDVDFINAYWDARQSFFSALQLPSFATQWQINEVLPAQNLAELGQDSVAYAGKILGWVSRRAFFILRSTLSRSARLVRCLWSRF